MKCVKCATAEAVRKSPVLCAKCYVAYLAYLGPESISMRDQRGVFVRDINQGGHRMPLYQSDSMRIEREVETEVARENPFDYLLSEVEAIECQSDDDPADPEELSLI